MLDFTASPHTNLGTPALWRPCRVTSRDPGDHPLYQEDPQRPAPSPQVTHLLPAREDSHDSPHTPPTSPTSLRGLLSHMARARET